MIKVITYGTYDLLHYGHIRLLERAKELGDYLIVGVTADDFDKTRGKINVQQSLMERVEAIRETGLADEIIIEEYEGQKIDDIRRYDVDIFTVGSDWIGKFDYLNEYCRVVYLERTEGVSSSNLRTEKRKIRLGLVGEADVLRKFVRESSYVNGMQISGIYTEDKQYIASFLNHLFLYETYEDLIKDADAVYIVSSPLSHYERVKYALERGKNVLCESPVALTAAQCKELFQLAGEKQCILMESIKTAYSTAYHRMMLLAKTGIIGKVVSVDATCTSIRKIDKNNREKMSRAWNSICAWGPTAMLPIFQMFGVDYKSKQIITCIGDEEFHYDDFTKIDFIYSDAVASLKVGKGIKAEGNLVISGTEGYIYVPAPWWKTEYFEIRFEHSENNRRYFYQLDGEGIRHELVSFVHAIEMKKERSNIDEIVSEGIARVIEEYNNEKDPIRIRPLWE